MRNFIRYYKWHMIFAVIVVICVGFMLRNTFSTSKPDLTIGYSGVNYINVQNFNDRKVEIEDLILKDANDDGRKLAELYAYTMDLEKDVEENFAEVVDSDSYDIYITTKNALESFEDKSKFTDVSIYFTIDEKKNKTLEDSSGRVYAISLDGNKYITDLGFLDTTDLYLAVAEESEKSDEISVYKKNARNVAGYILGEK